MWHDRKNARDLTGGSLDLFNLQAPVGLTKEFPNEAA